MNIGTDTHSVNNNDGYFGLLDALIVVAEAWKILVVAVILSVLAAFGYFHIQPKVYESRAVLSLDAAQLAQFSAPEFLRRSGIDGAMWKLDLSHATTGNQTYEVSFRSDSPQSAQAGLTALIEAFDAETAPDAARLEILHRSRDRILKALQNLENISEKLALEADNTLPGSESELYSRSVVMLLDAQAKQEDELLAIESELARSSGITVVAPSLPAQAVPQSFRAFAIAIVGGAVFLVLGVAFAAEALRRAGRTEAGAEKLRRLGRAFTLRR